MKNVSIFPGRAYRLILSCLQSNASLPNRIGRTLNKARVMLSKRWDPLVRLPVQGANLVLPLSHDLPIYAATLPFYNVPLKRLAQFVSAQEGELIMIDVGANVGDTALLCMGEARSKVLCVEGDSTFTEILRRNVSAVEGVEIVETYCSAADEVRKVVREREHGTSSIAAGAAGGSDLMVAFRQLDSVLSERPNFQGANLLKIDCDGFDFDVLRGAANLLRCRPALFFEADPFSRPDYINLALDTMRLLRASGYENVLLYDNYGCLFGKFSLADESAIKQAFSYQVRSKRLFYDVIALKPGAFEEFASSEENSVKYE